MTQAPHVINARTSPAITLEQTTMRTVAWFDEQGRHRKLSAGSGLVRLGNSLWIAGDDLHHLIEIPVAGNQPGIGHRVFPGELPEDFTARKKVKPDTEALFQIHWKNQNKLQHKLIAFPSGSKANRTRGARLTLGQDFKVLSTDYIDFSRLIEALNLRISDLNIEGGIVWDEKLVLFQRGNGKAKLNALVELDLGEFTEVFMSGSSTRENMDSMIRAVHTVELPEINGVQLTFTDCETVDGALYFAAAAEGGNDTYLDGEIMGSAIGRLGKNFAPEILGIIEKLKFEGLAFARAEGANLEFHLITDTDNPDLPSQLFTGSVPQKVKS